MDEHEGQFLQLVLGLQSSAWMMLGKVMNPVTKKTEKNLEAAKESIDMLRMLREKTKGNLSETEKGLLDNAISELQINFLAEKDKPEDKDGDKGSTEAGKEDRDSDKASG